MTPVHLLETSDIDLNTLAKRSADHKYGHGHALVLAGGPGKTYYS